MKILLNLKEMVIYKILYLLLVYLILIQQIFKKLK